MAVDFERRGIADDNFHRQLFLALQRKQDRPPYTAIRAALKTLIDMVPVTVTIRQIAPGNTCAEHIQHRAKNEIIADLWRSSSPGITAFYQWLDVLIEKILLDRKQTRIHGKSSLSGKILPNPHNLTTVPNASANTGASNFFAFIELP